MNNKTVLPSSLLKQAENKDYHSAFTNMYKNYSLKQGFIKKIYDTEDKQNLSKLAPEYDVLVLEQTEDKAPTPLTYKNCLALEAFGGIADFFEAKRSAPTKPDIEKLSDDDGSSVLLLCLDGNGGKGIIIGSLPHPQRQTTLTKAKEKHLESEFNGIRFQVDKDGQLTLTFKGPTDKKGKPTKTKEPGSQIKIEKDGSIELNDKQLDSSLKKDNAKVKPDQKSSEEAKSDEKYEKIRIDKTNQTLELFSRKDQNQATDGNYKLTVKENTTHKTKEYELTAEGKVTIKASGELTLEASGSAKLKAASLMANFDGDVQFQASSFKISAPSIFLGDGGSPALIFSTQFIGYGNLGAPVISSPIGPFSGSVFIAP